MPPALWCLSASRVGQVRQGTRNHDVALTLAALARKVADGYGGVVVADCHQGVNDGNVALRNTARFLCRGIHLCIRTNSSTPRACILFGLKQSWHGRSEKPSSRGIWNQGTKKPAGSTDAWEIKAGNAHHQCRFVLHV